VKIRHLGMQRIKLIINEREKKPSNLLGFLSELERYRSEGNDFTICDVFTNKAQTLVKVAKNRATAPFWAVTQFVLHFSRFNHLFTISR
jgi:hypothetical protein